MKRIITIELESDNLLDMEQYGSDALRYIYTKLNKGFTSGCDHNTDVSFKYDVKDTE